MATKAVKKITVPLIGGPFDGEKYKRSFGLRETLTFTAKGLCGFYRDGAWFPVAQPIEINTSGFVPFKKAIDL